jgi:hypothetical protein
MNTTRETAGYHDRSLIVKTIGGLMLLGGLGAALIGPVEVYAYYAFTEGGKFHYEGFGFGSFMFAYIASQVVGYYTIAAVFIPLGYGHLKRRRWARSLTLTGLWVWLVAGLPLTVIAYLMLFQSKELALPMVIAVMVIAPLIYPVAPLLLMRVYRGKNVQLTFEAADLQPSRLDETPLPVRGLCGLLILTIITLHAPLLLRGVFPFFGRLLADMEGFLALDLVIVALSILTWGVARQRLWSWWGALFVFGLITLSGIVTFVQVTLRDMLAAMQLPAYEMDLFQNVPILDGYYGLFLVSPLIVTLAIILLVRRHFGSASMER